MEITAMSINNLGALDTPKRRPNRQEQQDLRPLAVTVSMACRLSGVGTTSMWALIRDKHVATIKIGRRRLVLFASLERLVTRGTDQSKRLLRPSKRIA
jgi:hypothetical protein